MKRANTRGKGGRGKGGREAFHPGIGYASYLGYSQTLGRFSFPKSLRVVRLTVAPRNNCTERKLSGRALVAICGAWVFNAFGSEHPQHMARMQIRPESTLPDKIVRTILFMLKPYTIHFGRVFGNF